MPREIFTYYWDRMAYDEKPAFTPEMMEMVVTNNRTDVVAPRPQKLKVEPVLSIKNKKTESPMDNIRSTIMGSLVSKPTQKIEMTETKSDKDYNKAWEEHVASMKCSICNGENISTCDCAKKQWIEKQKLNDTPVVIEQSRSLAHKRIPDDVYDALPPIPPEQRTVPYVYPWNITGERYLREWNRHYNGLGQPFTLPTFLVKAE